MLMHYAKKLNASADFYCSYLFWDTIITSVPVNNIPPAPTPDIIILRLLNIRLSYF